MAGICAYLELNRINAPGAGRFFIQPRQGDLEQAARHSETRHGLGNGNRKVFRSFGPGFRQRFGTLQILVTQRCRLLFEFLAADFSMGQFVEFMLQSNCEVRQIARLDAVFSGDGLQRVQSFLNPIPPARVHVDAVFIAAQRVSRLSNLDARGLQQFKQRTQVWVKGRYGPDGPGGIGDQAVRVAIIAVDQRIKSRAQPIGEAAAIQQLLPLDSE